MKAGDVRRVVRVERIVVTQIVQQFGPLNGVGVAQAEQRVSRAQLRHQLQRSLVEADRGVSKREQERLGFEREIVVLHDRLSEHRLARGARLEATRELGPALLHLFAAPAALSAAVLGDQPGSLKVVEHTTHVEDEHPGHPASALAESRRGSHVPSVDAPRERVLTSRVTALDVDPAQAPPLLSPDEPGPFEVIEDERRSPFLITCDHAGKRIPRALADLGLPHSELGRHIAWDLGAAEVARCLARELGAFAILQTYSRLVIDCNRQVDVPSSIAVISENTVIPGNQGLSAAAAAERARAIFHPYHARILSEFERRERVQQPSILIAMHSFTPTFKGVARPWHAGMLYNRDVRLGRGLLELLREDPELVVGDNEPYAVSDLSDYGVVVYGERRGIPHVRDRDPAGSAAPTRPAGSAGAGAWRVYSPKPAPNSASSSGALGETAPLIRAIVAPRMPNAIQPLRWEVGPTPHAEQAPSEFVPAEVPGAVQLDWAARTAFPSTGSRITSRPIRGWKIAFGGTERTWSCPS